MRNEIIIEDVFEKIAMSSNYGNLGLFVGAGFSKAVLSGSREFSAYNWIELLTKANKEIKVNLDDILREHLSLPEIASSMCRAYALQNGLTYEQSVLKLKEIIAGLMNYKPGREAQKKYRDLFETLEIQWIITTNYDTLLESVFAGKSLSLSSDELIIKMKNLIPIYHLHGIRHNPSSIVITQQDYIELFRPTEYRQIKLPIILKESTTIFIGYGLGDINVQSAIDWTQKVFSQKNTSFCPNEVIQLLRVSESAQKPYRDENGVIIVEINEIDEFFQQLNAYLENFKNQLAEKELLLQEIKDELNNLDLIGEIIDDEAYAKSFFDRFYWQEPSLINEMLSFLESLFDDLHQSQRVNGAFVQYKKELQIILMLFESMGTEGISAVYYQFMAQELIYLSQYVGPEYGQSFSAYNFWNEHKNSIDKTIWNELQSYARCNLFGSNLYALLN
ncbi:SIR2 family NAD-dependent protein deacylase [Fusibacter bizertensis]